MNQSATYWYPTMNIPEIVEALASWGHSVSSDQLMRPTSDFVFNIYCSFLRQGTSLSHESLQEPLEAALATFETPDLYAQALAHNFILIHLQRLARAARIHGFSAKDIAFPESGRTCSTFSAFINFLKFSEQCDPLLTSLRDKSAAVSEERSNIMLQLEEARHRVDSIKARIAEDEPKCDILRKENETITAHLISCKDRQIAIMEDVRNLKQEKALVVQKKETIQQETEQAHESNSRTRSRIVQSPERIKRNIITMGSTAAEDKKTVAIHEAKIRDLQTRISALQTIEKDVRSCIEQLQTIEKEVHLLEASKKSLSDYKDQLSEKKGEVSELTLKRERVNKQLHNAQEKLERAQRHAEDKRSISQQTIDRLQHEYEEMAIERRDNDKHVEEMRAEADEVERKMAEHLKTSQAELNELLTEYWRLRHETEVYMETLANKLGMQVTST